MYTSLIFENTILYIMLKIHKKEGRIKMLKTQKDLDKKSKISFKQKKLKKSMKGITLIALVITILFSYDEKLKCSNSKGFLLQTI